MKLIDAHCHLEPKDFPATAEVIAETIPEEFVDEIVVWQGLRADLRNLVCNCDQY